MPAGSAHVRVIPISPLLGQSGEPSGDQQPIVVGMLIAVVRLQVKDSRMADLARHVSIDSTPARRR